MRSGHAVGPARASLLVFVLLALVGLVPPSLPTVAAADGCTSSGEPVWGNATSPGQAGKLQLQMQDGESNVDDLPFGGFGGTDEPRLRQLTEGFHTSERVPTNGSWAMQVNLTIGYRYTFCVDAYGLDEEGNATSARPEIDVYLLRPKDFDIYRQELDPDSLLAAISADIIAPEWQSIFQWIPYRDVHGYERVNSRHFSVSLDKSEATGGNPFTGAPAQHRPFYLVVDGIDNTRPADAPGELIDIGIDVGVDVESRFMLPNATVPFVCCLSILLLLAAPVVLHVQFNRAGRPEEIVELMPSLNTVPEAPPLPVPPAPVAPMAPVAPSAGDVPLGLAPPQPQPTAPAPKPPAGPIE